MDSMMTRTTTASGGSVRASEGRRRPCGARSRRCVRGWDSRTPTDWAVSGGKLCCVPVRRCVCGAGREGCGPLRQAAVSLPAGLGLCESGRDCASGRDSGTSAWPPSPQSRLRDRDPPCRGATGRRRSQLLCILRLRSRPKIALGPRLSPGLPALLFTSGDQTIHRPQATARALVVRLSAPVHPGGVAGHGYSMVAG